MNAQQLNRGRNFNSVRFNQDKGAPGHSTHKLLKPKYQGNRDGHHGSKQQGNGGQHAPKHKGGSLEELLIGGYKGKPSNFDPKKSNKYNALMAYFQKNDQSATGAHPVSSNGASAAGQASANAILSPSLPFAFAMTIDVSSSMVDF
jgi:hypothetical protein